MADDALIPLRQAVDLTRAMLEMAQDHHWSSLPEMQQKRTLLLEQIFPLEEAQRTSQNRTLMETMIADNQQLERVCREAQQTLRLELSDLNKNRKAVAAYQSS
jgi:hypothetical protein